MAGFIDCGCAGHRQPLEGTQGRGEPSCWRRVQRSPAAAQRAPADAARRPPRSAAATPSDPHSPRPGRPRGRRGGNTRSAQALELVRSKPGITIPEIATAMKIEPNYLYRVMPKLTSDGLVTRDGQGWHPAGRRSCLSRTRQSLDGVGPRMSPGPIPLTV